MNRAPIAAARSACRSGLAALPAWCLALLFATVQLSDVAHMLVVRHVRCAEHGAWEHGEAHGARGGEPHGVHAAQALEGAQALAADADYEHGHEACTCTAERRDAAVVPAGQSLDALFPQARSLIVSHAARCATRDVLACAPKTSPPV